jgi:DHA1 family multidrug resistance protein-like MFS transporter
VGAAAELMRRPVLGSLLTANLVFSFAFAAFVSNIVVFLIGRFNAGAASMAAILVVSGIVRVLIFPLVGKLVALFGEKRLGIAGMLLLALTLVGISVAPQFWMMYPLVILNSIGAGFVFATVGAMAPNQLPLNEQGKLAGVNTALAGVGNIAGPLWAGIAYDSIAPAAPYLSAALFLLMAAGLVLQARVNRVQVAAHSAAFGE